MRRYVDEQLWDWDNIKPYILNLSEMPIEGIFHEYVKEHERLYPQTKDTSENVYGDTPEEFYKNRSTTDKVDMIAKVLEERYYIFEDDEEHAWNMEVVRNTLNGIPVRDRWTGEEYI